MASLTAAASSSSSAGSNIPSPSTGLDVVKAVQQYITKMVSEVTGMKVLLLDTETVRLLWIQSPSVLLWPRVG